MKYIFTEEEKEHFISVCNNASSMRQAAIKLGLHFNTFKRYAVKFNCYNTNQSGKGIRRKPYKNKISTEDILNGCYPQYQTYKLKIRLLREGYFEDKCSKCGWSEKRNPQDEFSTCELHHKDGDNSNHRLDNLDILCPNCHSLTDTYRFKNVLAKNKQI